MANASRDYFVETGNGYYSVDTTNGALQSYKVVVKFVGQLITGFRMPSNLKIIPEKEPLQITPIRRISSNFKKQ